MIERIGSAGSPSGGNAGGDDYCSASQQVHRTVFNPLRDYVKYHFATAVGSVLQPGGR